MKFKDFVFSNSKKIIGSALLLSLMAVQTVGATGGITDSLKSKGNIEYDANGDGQADVYFYSKDLTTIAGGVEDINSNMAILSQSFTDLTTASNGYKSDIIAGLNSNVYAKNNIPADSTFEDIISKINNIPAPTTATGNVWSGGDNSGIGITSNGQSVNIDGVTSLNLAVNESVTLPSGYYPNDITISNNVANRGSLNSAQILDASPVNFPEGFYTSSKVNEIYNEGVIRGGISSLAGATVTYNLVHQHRDGNGNISSNDDSSTVSGGCYTQQYSWSRYELIDVTHEGCQSWELTGDGRCNKEIWGNRTYTVYKRTCEHTYGEFMRSTTDYDSITDTEAIKDITVELF